MKWIGVLILAGLYGPVSGQDSDGKHHPANRHMHQGNLQDLINRFEDPERDIWQKPEEVIELFGNVADKVVLDIGAGSGYFSFRLAAQGARVIAADVDDNFQSYIADKKVELGYSDDQIKLKKIPYDSPQLDPESIDLAIIVNTYHHIDQRAEYFEQVYQGLRPGGSLMVVDFKPGLPEAAPGPPDEMKIPASQVVKELEASGFNDFKQNHKLLVYQYVIMANK